MDILDFGRYIGALLLVMALLGFAWLAARRYGLPGIVQGTTARRLSVIESLMIGPKHRLYLFRHDDKEHLVLIGPQSAEILDSSASRATLPVTSAAPSVVATNEPS